MNTSDESVYYMDTAFKRRWDFEHMPWQGAGGRRGHANATGRAARRHPHRWVDFLSRLNSHIAETFAGRNVDDKQIGLWFLRNNQTGRNKALTALRESLRPLISPELQSEWVKVFPGAENYDLGEKPESGVH